jgi:MFS family permease
VSQRSDRLSPDFWRLWAATATSNIGDGIRITALPLLIAAITRDPLIVSGVTAVTLAPWLLFSLPGGVIVDRVDRRRLMVGWQLGRSLAVAGLAAAIVFGVESVWLIYLTGFVIGTGEVFVDTSLQAAIPMLATEDQLENANSKFLAVQFITNDALGGPVGAWLFATAAALPFGVDAATFLLAAFLVTRIRLPLQRDREDREMPMWPAIKEGIDFLREDDLLRRIAYAVAGANLAVGASGSILVLLALDVLDLSEFGFGLLVASSAVGGFLGALSARAITARTGRRFAMTVGTGLLAVGQFALGLSTVGLMAGAAMFLGGFGVSLFSVVGRALRQAIAPDRILGRVVTTFRLIGIGSVPLGAVSGGLIADAAGIRTPYILAGILLVFVTAIVYLTMTDSTVATSLARRHASDG